MHIFDRASPCVFLTRFTSARCYIVKKWQILSCKPINIVCMMILFPPVPREGSRWKMEIDLYLNDAQHEWLIAVFILDCSFFFFGFFRMHITLGGPQQRIAFECCSRERPISVKPANKMPIAAFVCECTIACFWFSRKAFMIFSSHFYSTTNM